VWKQREESRKLVSAAAIEGAARWCHIPLGSALDAVSDGTHHAPNAAPWWNPLRRFIFILSLRNTIVGCAFVRQILVCVSCPRTAFTLAKQQRRCSKWQRPLPIPLLRSGLLKPPPSSKTRLASYPREWVPERQTCSPRENRLRGAEWGPGKVKGIRVGRLHVSEARTDWAFAEIDIREKGNNRWRSGIGRFRFLPGIAIEPGETFGSSDWSAEPSSLHWPSEDLASPECPRVSRGIHGCGRPPLGASRCQAHEHRTNRYHEHQRHWHSSLPAHGWGGSGAASNRFRWPLSAQYVSRRIWNRARSGDDLKGAA